MPSKTAKNLPELAQNKIGQVALADFYRTLLPLAWRTGVSAWQIGSLLASLTLS
jgi:hypothetical protein